ncbi:GNAT family N-acetyltransferase [Paenibacillus dendritiformis]|uniref:GNAT family N-acetyltransferase n=1 Tax=Paenibacillus dendritiformis TaxID=130049 RepID=UPI00105A433E|nr:GNAT family N-acetyltransferase [Paenibacillus dendritiformis]TDL57003.1 GNAT family N-acetyltransferase [Paenibacillus dendritiformis]
MSILMEEPLHIKALTCNQPFCAGVFLIREERVVMTLNADMDAGGDQAARSERVLRIGGVGGGQEPGETMPACALREAREELATERVWLKSSPVTYFHDMDTGEIRPVTVRDELAPFLLQRATNPAPDQPYKPGLPVGPYIYYGIYAAEADESEPLAPGDDVAALLSIPIGSWDEIEQGMTLSEALAHGCTVTEAIPLHRDTRLHVPDTESMRMIMRLYPQFIEASGIELRPLALTDGSDIYEMLQTMGPGENGFSNSGYGIHPTQFRSYLKSYIQMSQGRRLPAHLVPQNVYWLYVQGWPVGIGKLRHALNDALRERGGHIGYAIRPEARRRGYGTVMLRLLLAEARRIGLREVLLTCDEDNTASRRVIEKNGGRLTGTADGICKYWVTL